MKVLSLFVSAAALLSASSAFAAIDCGTPPSCKDLGYVDEVSNCPNHVIKCPFDTTKGKCVHPAAIGEIAFFAAWPGPGWLGCTGLAYKKSSYPLLAEKLGNTFCDAGKYHAKCSSDEFAVPDYRGAFFRGGQMDKQIGVDSSGTPITESINGTLWSSTQDGFLLPKKVAELQEAQLPNIIAYAVLSTGLNKKASGTTPSGAFSLAGDWGSKGLSTSKSDDAPGVYTTGLSFDASKSNSIYKTYGTVLPRNYAVKVYIYAGDEIK